MASLFVACALASAIIAVWTVYLPTASNPILSNFAPFKLTEIVEGVQKANRLPRLRFEDRWNAVIQKTSSTPNRIEEIPVGCETAFGPLLKTQKFLARCLASNDEIGIVALG